MLIGHLYIFGETSVQILCPFCIWVMCLNCKCSLYILVSVPYQVYDQWVGGVIAYRNGRSGKYILVRSGRSGKYILVDELELFLKLCLEISAHLVSWKRNDIRDHIL